MFSYPSIVHFRRQEEHVCGQGVVFVLIEKIVTKTSKAQTIHVNTFRGKNSLYVNIFWLECKILVKERNVMVILITYHTDNVTEISLMTNVKETSVQVQATAI